MPFATILDKLISFAGLGIVLYAYVPQIRHLLQEHCSAGISRRAYVLWLIAAAMLLVHSIMIRDLVFIILQCLVTALTGFILVLAKRYSGQTCPAHEQPAPNT